MYAHLEGAVFAVQGRPPGVVRIGGVSPGSVLPQDRQFVVLESSRLRVRRGGDAVGVHENSSGGCDPFRPPEVEHPAHRIQHVYAHVADDAVAVFHEIAPSARVDDLVERYFGRRACPHFVVQFVRGRDCRGIAARAHMVIAVRFRKPDTSEPPRAHIPIAGLYEVGRAPPLHSHLDHAPVLAGGGNHRLAFHHVHADGLLHPHVQPGAAGVDHGQRVPVIRRVDQHEIEIARLNHLAVVGERARTVTGSLPSGDDFHRSVEHVPVHIA